MARPKLRYVSAGQRFGRGVVIDPEVSLRHSRKGVLLASPLRGARLRCDCGSEYETALGSLFRCAVMSCGCLRREMSRARITEPRVQQLGREATTKHGMAGARREDYNRWRAMIRRCENPASAGYANYGGRGIAVCPRWRNVLLYLADLDRLLGPRPPGTSLDRIDNDGDYEPGNVRWAVRGVQSRNRRPRRAGVPRGAIYLPRHGVWVAKIQLGTCTTAEEAGALYQQA